MPKSKPDAKAAVPETGYGAAITRFLGTLDKHLPSPDSKHNSGRYYGDAYMWKAIEDYAKKKKEKLWEDMAKQDVIAAIGDHPGDYELGQSSHFTVIAKVSERVRRFSEEKLTELLVRKHKLTAPVVKQLIDASKVPTDSTVTKKIIERSV